ncbi:MAG: chemotaxis protein, partial [Nitrospirae bacterium]|nr:chemotaxis protein [Nitrospirota bacterium]
RTLDGMDHLKERIQAVADKILLLGDFTVQIGNIANLVKDLADQTNMLALNAAVEAVRAGEHGKGFAVLAGEVRKLADESKKSAEHANTLISDIQKATNATIMVTEEGTKTVDEVTGLARKVGTLFDNLAESSNNVFEKAQQVLLNTRQQSTALNQVVDAINSINTGARETAAGITQTKVGVDRLKEAAQGLQTVVYGSGNGRVPR